uniref:Eukaryotic translation initiation factor 3 subunit A n=1 Tax=Pan troglodytes TaxID=9598 RepID=H2Q2N4_PANTR
MPAYFQRPENALKRANGELEKAACSGCSLYVMKSKKHEHWQKIHEPIMLKYLNFAVDFRVYQYKDICQQDVVRAYLKMAEEKTEAAKEESQDLDNIQTPESGEDTQDRTDRLLLTPCLIRQCLDLLRNNSRVERRYHDIAQQACKFWPLQYTRKAEFRNCVSFENALIQSMHLETRLVQLIQTVEIFHGLFSFLRKLYNKVSLCWNLKCSFHASTLHQMRKNLTQDEMQRMSTRVLLATLSIPITPERTDIARLLDMDGIIVEKQRRLATLLGLQAPPTRIGLINDMVRFNVLQYVVPEVKDLYNWLEVEFNPLKLCERVTKVLNWVREQPEKEPELQQYVPQLQNNTILRLLQQVSQIYQSIEFSRLTSLVPFVDAFQLERAIVDAARHCDLQVRIDHTSRTLSFGSDLNYATREDAPIGPHLQSMPSEQIRNQLTAMSSVLAKALEVIKPAHILQEKEEQHQLAVTAYLKNSRKEHQRILARRQTIEERKERLESLNIQREKEELEQREAELQKVRKAEEERLRQEAKEREKERILQEHEQIKKKTVRERLEQIKKTELGAKAFKDIDIEDLEELDPDFIMAKQVEQLEKEKKELQERLKNQEKKIDYFERAKRLEEIPLIKSAYEEQRIKDMDLWEQQEEERITTMQLEREKALEHKNRMSRMLEDRDLFVMRLKAARQSVYEEKLKQFEERLAEERHNRLEERKRQRKEERRITYYREKEEEEQRRAEEQMLKEREERERAERAKREEELREYQERVKKLEEVERKKRQRELEIEERERRREEERRLGDSSLSRKDSRWGDRDSEGTWRKGPEADSEWRRGPPEKEWRRGEGRDEDRSHRRDEERPRRLGDDEDRESSLRPDDDRVPRRGMDDDRGPRRGPEEDRFSRRGADDDRPSWRNTDDDRPPRRIADEDRGNWRHADDDRPPRRGLDEDRGSWRTADEDRGPRRGMDDDRGPRRGGADDERSSWRNADDDRGPRRGLDDDRGPRRGMDDDRGPRRGMDDDRGPRRGMDDDRGPRRGLDDDRGPWRNADDDRIPRRGAEDDRGPWRNMDDDRLSRRADDDRFPRRGDDSRPGPWRPLVKPGGWREKEKAREESWGPPRESRPSEEREWDREKERDRDNQDREENDKDPERERDRERDVDREDRFRRPRDEGGWRRGPAEESSSWRDSSRRDDRDRDDRRRERDDRRDLRERRDLRDDRDRRGPPLRSEREEVSSWRRADDRKDDRVEERDPPRRVPPPALSRDRERDRDREREGEKEKASWRAEKDRESLRRTKNETDEDGWTTVRR